MSILGIAVSSRNGILIFHHRITKNIPIMQQMEVIGYLVENCDDNINRVVFNVNDLESNDEEEIDKSWKLVNTEQWIEICKQHALQ